MLRKLKSNNGSILVSVIMISSVLFILSMAMLHSFGNSLKMNVSTNESEQAYLTAKSGLSAVCDYYEDNTNVATHKNRLKALKTIATESGTNFDGSFDTTTNMGTCKINIKGKERTQGSNKYLDTTITSMGTVDGKSVEVFKKMTFLLPEEDPTTPTNVAPYYDNAFTSTGSTGDLKFTNGILGTAYTKSTGTIGFKSSDFIDFNTEGNYQTYDGSSVHMLSVVAGGFATILQSEVIENDVLARGWVTVGGKGAGIVKGKVVSETGVSILSSGTVGLEKTSEGATPNYADIDALMSEGKVFIANSSYKVKTISYWPPEMEPLMESDGITPVVDKEGYSFTSDAVQIYGNVIAKDDVYNTCVVRGNIYTRGDVYLSGNCVVYGDIYAKNINLKEGAKVEGHCYASGIVTNSTSATSSAQCHNGSDIEATLNSKIPSGHFANTASTSLETIRESNQDPTYIKVPDYLTEAMGG